jgi:hypothetical protein
VQIEDVPEDNNVIIVSEDTGGQVKSFQPKQRSIDPIKEGESVEDPSLEHVYQDGEKKDDAHKANEGKGRDKQRSRRPKLSFEELLAKYDKIVEENVANRPKKIQSPRLPPKHKSQGWNWQGSRSHAATCSPFEQPIPMSCGPQPAYFHLIHLGARLMKRHMLHHILGHNM